MVGSPAACSRAVCTHGGCCGCVGATPSAHSATLIQLSMCYLHSELFLHSFAGGKAEAKPVHTAAPRPHCTHPHQLTHLSCSPSAACCCSRASSAACTACSSSSSSAARCSAACSAALSAVPSTAAAAHACSAAWRAASARACCCWRESITEMSFLTAVSGPGRNSGVVRTGRQGHQKMRRRRGIPVNAG